MCVCFCLREKIEIMIRDNIIFLDMYVRDIFFKPLSWLGRYDIVLRETLGIDKSQCNIVR